MRFRVRIMTGREVQGAAWARKRPALADHLWVVATGGGKRHRIPIGEPTPENWQAAERKRAQLERLLAAPASSVVGKLRAPTVREAADAYLERAKKRRAPATVHTRTQQLVHLCAAFGDQRVDALAPETIFAWWEEYVEDAKRSTRTGRGHLEALSQVLVDSERQGTKGIAFGALATARRWIKDSTRGTKKSRAKRDASLDVAPLSPDEAAAFGVTLEGWGDHDARLFAVLGVDGGLRLGELLALTWRDFDGERLRVHQSRDATGKLGPTKTGRERTVQVSRRARRLLKERRLECGARAKAGSRVLRFVTRPVYRRKLAAIAKEAGIAGHVKPTTLRHTFGSLLVMAGIPLSYVAAQLGHASIAVTEQHYARWIPSEGYRTPPQLVDGEVPADLLSRLATSAQPVKARR